MGLQIWQPAVGTTWQYVLSQQVNLTSTKYPIAQADVWIIDVLDTPASTVKALHQQNKKVIGYFSAGTYENWRSDAKGFLASDLGEPLDDWEGERWVQTKSQNVRSIMKKRMDIAVSKGFDGIDPDNVDGYDNDNGLGLTTTSAVDFVYFLAAEAHARGLSMGLKNAGEIVPQVISVVEYSVQEQAVKYGETDLYTPFIQRKKPIFNVEYPKGTNPDSAKQNNETPVIGSKKDKSLSMKSKGWSSIIKNVRLDQWVQTQ